MASDFIRDMVAKDVANGKHGGVVRTRFPPEPNGYLHIGHAKSICLNFGIAQEFGGSCNLRMDDTNPETEDMEYVEAIQRDVEWLGFKWAGMFYASDYYPRLYELAEKLIALHRAYVCDCDEETMSRLRGTITEAGVACVHRSRTPGESLELFRRMKNGEFPDGSRVLRAAIDMASPNMKMRDPPLYRIKLGAHHYRTGDTWKIYPLYDYAHCLSDSAEGITHSLCTTEFESARELYDWVLRACEVPWLSEQTEFARLNLTYTVMSKRKLLQLVENEDVSGWDDPRMPTIAGMRRRGYTPEAIREFCAKIGVAKNLSVVDIALLEHTLRDDLDKRSRRVMGVLRPLRLTVAEVSDGFLDASYWPADSGKASETRRLPVSGTVFIERSDFEENPPKDFHRLAPGKSVRLRHAFVVKCTDVVKDAAGNVVEVRCVRDDATSPKGTIHWVDAARSIEAEVRLYDRLFTVEEPGANGDFRADLNPASLEVVRARVEPSLASAKAGEHFQLERTGFFVVDPDTKPGALVLGRTVTLKDSWAKKPAAAPRKPAAAAEKKPAAKPAKQAELAPELRALVADAVAAGAPEKETTTLVQNELVGAMRAAGVEKPSFGGAQLAELVGLVASGKLSSTLAKDVLAELLASGGSPKAIVEKKGLSVISDASALEGVVKKVVHANPELVQRVKGGNANVIGALFGMAMRESGGRADPKALRQALEQALR